MKFGLFYELQLPRPLDKDQWNDDDELRIVQETLEQAEFADKLGFDYVFLVEHHFLEEYCHCSAPEVMLAAMSQRTKSIRLGHGIVQMPPLQNHPVRVAERIATLDPVSHGRVGRGPPPRPRPRQNPPQAAGPPDFHPPPIVAYIGRR